MKNLAKSGKSILFITHKINEILEVADRCTVLRKGKCIGTIDVSKTSKEELSEMMVGRKIDFTINKIKETTLKKYGVDSFSKTKQFKDYIFDQQISIQNKQYKTKKASAFGGHLYIIELTQD